MTHTPAHILRLDVLHALAWLAAGSAVAFEVLRAVGVTYQQLLATDPTLVSLALTMYVMDATTSAFFASSDELAARERALRLPRGTVRHWSGRLLLRLAHFLEKAAKKLLLYVLVVLAGIMLGNGLKRIVWHGVQNVIVLDKLVLLGVAWLSAQHMLTNANAFDIFADAISSARRLGHGDFSHGDFSHGSKEEKEKEVEA